jgi:hypothetical protein
MAFYVSHMSPVKRARIHKGSCVHCRDGKGQENQIKNGSGATGWSDPFGTLDEAKAYMGAQFSTYTDTGLCQHCKPGVD